MKLTYTQYGIPGSITSRRIPNGYKAGTGKTYKPNGARECARRRKQLRNGMLKLG